MSAPDHTRPQGAETEPAAPLMEFPRRLPDEWVKQLANAAPPIWPTLLGSAVLAALIGWASSYFTAQMTISANLDLERTKAKLQLAQEQARTRGTAYANLAASLNDLHNAYASYVVLVGVSNGTDAKEKTALSAQLALVGLAERKVGIANRGPNMDSTVLTSDVDSCLAQLTPVLMSADKNPKSVLSQKALDDTIVELIQRARQSTNAPLQ
jgi:hypothetical protein